MSIGRDKIFGIAATVIPGLVVAGTSLSVAMSSYGMPLDDAYIFEQYVHNLAGGAGFSFNPGETSFGCTSLVWPLMLAGIIKLIPGVDYAYLVQAISIILSAVSISLASKFVILVTRNKIAGLAAGLVLAFSPHVYMNTVSGMESALFACALLLVVTIQAKGCLERKPMLMGGAAAFVFIIRPEGLMVGAILLVAWVLANFGREEGLKSRKALLGLARYLVGYIIVVFPFMLFVRLNSDSFMPTTYMGKILTTDPNMLTWPVTKKALMGLKFFVDGWYQLLSPMRYLGAVVFPVAIIGVVFLLWQVYSYLRLGKESGHDTGIMTARLIIAALMALPFVYGYSFPAGPPFGGYYQRYIMVSLIAVMMEGALGLTFIMKKLKISNKTLIALPLVAAIFYQGFLYVKSKEFHKNIFIEEVEVNEDLRARTAEWIRINTPPDAKIFIGDVGLGVVGHKCERYVLDMGALINPDIFPYLERTKLFSDGRWDNMFKYMRVEGADYMVFFTTPTFWVQPYKDERFAMVQKIRRKTPGNGPRLEEISIFSLKPDK